MLETNRHSFLIDSLDHSQLQLFVNVASVEPPLYSTEEISLERDYHHQQSFYYISSQIERSGFSVAEQTEQTCFLVDQD